MNANSRLTRLEQIAAARGTTETAEPITHDAAACAAEFDSFAAELSAEQREAAARKAKDWSRYIEPKPRTTDETQ